MSRLPFREPARIELTMAKKHQSPMPPKHWRPLPSETDVRQQVASLLHRAQAQFRAAAYRDARDTSRRVLEIDSKSAEAYHLLGAIAAQEKNFSEAETLLSKAISINRQSPYFRHSLGNVHRERGDYESAAAAYRQALKLDPGLAAPYLGLALAVRGLGRPHDALAYLQQYLARAPKDAEGHNELALTFRELGKLDSALEHLRAALRIRPDHRAARINIARTFLLAENFREGWPAWLQSFTNLKLPDPGSGGAPFDGKRVVVYGTEGVGDEVMFASCVPDLTARAAEVTLHCDRRLVALFQRSFPSVRTLGMDKEGAQRTIGLVAPDEIHILASFLPAYFRPNVETYPARRSFLQADPAQVAEWRSRLSSLGPGPKVGLSWRGGVDPIDRSRRSIALSAWAPVLRVHGVHFVNVQYGDVRGEVQQALEQTAVPIRTWNDANPLTDLDFFAAQLAALDLVISVDNTTVHMAGALGTPVWALLPWLPDWRWTMTGTRTPWYPSVQLFRQEEAGRWADVMQGVRTLLRESVATILVDAQGGRSDGRIGAEG